MNAIPFPEGPLPSDPLQDRASRPVARRVVLHFPGFEPLDAALHHDRYRRAAAQSAATWEMDIETGDLCREGNAAWFDVTCQSGAERTESRIHILDHDTLVSALNGRPLWRRVASGYVSAMQVALTGGMVAYFRHAWRFGLFFIFPFLLVALSTAITAAIAALPLMLGLPALHLIWSLAVAAAFFRFVFMPVATRLHTLHLFADWDLAVAMARLDRPDVDRWLAIQTESVRAALAEPADEYLITSHSMGSTMAAHVIGRLLEEEPVLYEGKRISFVTLGGAILQCALLSPATRLRERVGHIARTSNIFWLEIQCLTDSVHFYRSRVVSLCGHADAPQARIAFIRIKRLLADERYRRIKRDFLRVHRQYVLGSEKRSNFDFTLLTAGPLPATDFENLSADDVMEARAHSIAVLEAKSH